MNLLQLPYYQQQRTHVTIVNCMLPLELHSFLCRKEWVKELEKENQKYKSFPHTHQTKVLKCVINFSTLKVKSWVTVGVRVLLDKGKYPNLRNVSVHFICLKFACLFVCLWFLKFLLVGLPGTKLHLCEGLFTFPSFEIWIMPMIKHYLNHISLWWAEIFSHSYLSNFSLK